MTSILDAVSSVLSAVHYTEYGVPSAAWEGPAFTGEPRDANALQNHRARYYAPGLAVWTALDPWEGLYTRPMSLNGYSWVEGQVVNATDASGEAVDIEKIETGFTIYSCNCGWIDLTHTAPAIAATLLTAVSHALNHGVYSNPASKGVAFQFTALAESGRWLSDNQPIHPARVVLGYLSGLLPWYFIPKTLDSALRNFIGLGIFLDLVAFIEEHEASFPDFSRIGIDFHSSSYSVEDLPSYYMGFYIARRLEEAGRSDDENVFRERDNSALASHLQSLAVEFLDSCGLILSVADNRRIFHAESEANRPQNRSFLPVDRVNHPTIDEFCGDTPRGQDRLPYEIFWPIILGEETLRAVGAGFRRSEKNQGCRMMSNLPFPTNPGGPLELFECGEGC